jgi:hypothetical protein
MEHLKTREGAYIPPMRLTLPALEIAPRDLPNRVNRDALCGVEGLVYPPIFSTDLDDLWLLATFGDEDYRGHTSVGVGPE